MVVFRNLKGLLLLKMSCIVLSGCYYVPDSRIPDLPSPTREECMVQKSVAASNRQDENGDVKKNSPPLEGTDTEYVEKNSTPNKSVENVQNHSDSVELVEDGSEPEVEAVTPTMEEYQSLKKDIIDLKRMFFVLSKTCKPQVSNEVRKQSAELIPKVEDSAKQVKNLENKYKDKDLILENEKVKNIEEIGGIESLKNIYNKLREAYQGLKVITNQAGVDKTELIALVKQFAEENTQLKNTIEEILKKKSDLEKSIADIITFENDAPDLR